MKSKVLVLILLFSYYPVLFALGSVEETESETKKDQWLLCVANFDSSSLAQNKKSVANTVMRKLVENIDTISYRTRVSSEYAYYEAAAWARARTNAAKALETKLNERSLALYRGDPEWKYRRNIVKIDGEIEKLRLVFKEADNNVPFVDNEPLFNLSADNHEFKFPDAPVPGNEYKFCMDHKSDAVLTGSIVEFHERFIVSWKLYTIYTRSFIWEDSIIFSHNDLDSAMAEIMRRLVIVLSGNEPAVLTVNAEPEDTLVLINRSFAGRGEISGMEHMPGMITITASAPDHESLTFDTELFPGEYTDINIRLWPVEYGNVEISGFSFGNVYHGALFVGEAPLTLRLPVNQMDFIELLSSDNSRGTIAFQTPAESDYFNSMQLRTGIPSAKGQLDKARRMFYWSWGGTWLAGIAAWITYQTFVSFNNAISYDFNQTGAYNENFYGRNTRMYNISRGAMITLGVAAIIDLFFMGRYIYIANRGSTPISKEGGVK
ncbi:MAG: hypothetical protein LBI28_13935 [Treponema sp.]|nr:hypothetical protein [Treponema sp.]